MFNFFAAEWAITLAPYMAAVGIASAVAVSIALANKMYRRYGKSGPSVEKIQKIK